MGLNVCEQIMSSLLNLVRRLKTILIYYYSIQYIFTIPGAKSVLEQSVGQRYKYVWHLTRFC